MKSIFSGIIICLSVLLSVHCDAQEDSLVNYLFNRIAALQVKADDYFLRGSFPSYITNSEHFHNRKEDNNIFFNLLIDYTLKHLRDKVSLQNQMIIDSIHYQTLSFLNHFKNRNGRNTYNFWRTDTTFNYPYAHAAGKKLTLPDDMDDTVLALLAMEADDSTNEAVHRLMQLYINSDTNHVRSVIKNYDTIAAYSTWFGKNFPVVFDVSVLCNVLAFVEINELDWTKADSASLDVIIQTVQNNYHISEPVYASPYYPKTALILYHIARLMSIQPIPQLEALKNKLIEDARDALQGSNNLLEKIILSSALIKWGVEIPSLQLPGADNVSKEIEQNSFAFFAGNVPSYLPDFIRKVATRIHAGIYHHYCPAYNDVLLLEYLILKQH